MEAASRFGRELEQAGVPTKLELVRAFAGHVARSSSKPPATTGWRDRLGLPWPR